MHRIIHADCLQWLGDAYLKQYITKPFACAFADPPDNIGLKYDGFVDKIPNYYGWCYQVLLGLLNVSPVAWWSFNAKHTVKMGALADRAGFIVKPCVQTYTFGQHCKTDLGNGHRPLWRISLGDYPLYPEQIRVESWRMRNGDKRAAPGGRVPSDVFDFPRVTGNSKQRRAWHKTQLHEGLIERAIKLVTKEGDTVLDPFGGTGTTLRVCRRIGRQCTLIEKSPVYYDKLREEYYDAKDVQFVNAMENCW